jgi:RNA polymerase sigma-70 factor (ECF subfamily)
MLGNVSDSEDVTQDVFLKAMTRLGSLREPSQFGAWIAQIARNLCRDHIKKSSRRRELLELHGKPRGNIDNEEFSALYDALRRLPEHYRLPLVLFYFDGRSTKGIASALELTQAGACTRISRARKELRRLLETQEVRS